MLKRLEAIPRALVVKRAGHVVLEIRQYVSPKCGGLYTYQTPGGRARIGDYKDVLRSAAAWLSTLKREPKFTIKEYSPAGLNMRISLQEFDLKPVFFNKLKMPVSFPPTELEIQNKVLDEIADSFLKMKKPPSAFCWADLAGFIRSLKK